MAQDAGSGPANGINGPRARATTPTRPPAEGQGRPPPTPEHVRVMQENRLKAKARIQQQAAAQYPQYSLNANAKRALHAGPVPLEQSPTIGPNGSLRSLPSTSRNPAAASSSSAATATSINPRTGRPNRPAPGSGIDDPNNPLPRDKSLGDYIEFDLSRLHNSKGGFLVDEDDLGPGQATAKTIQEVKRERERERQRIREAMEPGIVLDDRTQICDECGSKELNDQLARTFGVKVCRVCERKMPEKYSLLTKTEVKEDYLLTDAELRDEELLPHLLKANPHKSTYSNMMLFLRSQVEAYAFSEHKWGSEQGLDDEFERRQEEKSRKRGKKFMQGLQELRKRTRDNVWQKRQDERHRHVYVDADPEDQDGGDEEDDAEGTKKQVCEGCGHTIYIETF
ncbi:unnamed protein product [Parajaminaea phylloscopi]